MNKTLIILFSILVSGLAWGQTYQSRIDTMWCSYHYEQVGNNYTKTSTSISTMKGWPANNTKLVYFWRMGPGHTKARLKYKPTFMRMPQFGVKIERVNTGQILMDTTIATTAVRAEDTYVDIIPDFIVPADEYYRVEFTINNNTYVNTLYYFLFQRESTLPVVYPVSMGGTGSHLFDWASTDPYAPAGAAYDWAYVEGMVPYEYQHPCDYFMTIGALNSYMGFQTVGRTGNEFYRRVLFSVWDNGNTDENPDLPDYMRSEVFDYNHKAVSGHGGGEGSSGTVMFKDKTNLWHPDEWIQFLLNVRPENVTVKMSDKRGNDSIVMAENTIMTAWYKNESDTAWNYMGSIRASFLNSLINGWYSFIENFGGAERWGKHRVNYRHAFMRSAASGEWYSRNYVGYTPCVERGTLIDAGHGAGSKIDNSFYLEYGGYYTASGDSSHYTSLLDDHTCVDTINLDALNKRIDQATKLAKRYVVNKDINEKSEVYPKSAWTVVSADGINPTDMLDGDELYSHWNSTSVPHVATFMTKEQKTITAFTIKYPGEFAVRCRLVDVEYSDDGENWTLGADSIYIYNVTASEVTLPQPLTAKYFRLKFYDNIEGSTLSISDIVFKGAYNMESLKSQTQQLMAVENCLNGYRTADMQQLKEVYDNGNCTDAVALSGALKELAANGMPLKYGKVRERSAVASSSAYMIQNSYGNGYLCATPDGKLVIKGATIDGAGKEVSDTATCVNPYNCWQILSSDKYEGKYLYNMGLKKYFDFNSATLLSDTPAALALGGSGSIFYFLNDTKATASAAKYLNLDALEGVVAAGGRTNGAYFKLLANECMRPTTQEALDLVKEVTKPQRLNSYKAKVESLLALNDEVGALADADERLKIEQLYDNGNIADEDLEALAELVDNASYVEIDNAHTYRLVMKDLESSTPCMSVGTTDNDVKMAAESNASTSQMWTIEKNGDGYKLYAQNSALAMMPIDGAGKISLTSVDKGFKYHFGKLSQGLYFIQQSQYQPYTLCGASSSVMTQLQGKEGCRWSIVPVKEYTVNLNAVGTNMLCVDFDLAVPENVSAYIAYSVTNDGVIKLAQIDGVIPANTPVLLKGDAYAKIFFGVMGHEYETYDGKNLFVGTIQKKTGLAKKTYFQLKTSGSSAVMKKGIVASNIAENQAYMLVTEGLPEMDTYTFDFDDIIDKVESVPTAANRNSGNDVYDLQGRKVIPTKGIYIEGNKKVLR